MDELKQDSRNEAKLAEPRSYDDELANHEHVSMEVERAAQMIKGLEEALGGLTKRLSPVLIGDTSQVLRESAPEPVRCSLATWDAAIGDHAYELVCRVDELRASIDL